jgi:menaquinol-cytochrome c reductase iron-sulfur subunit
MIRIIGINKIWIPRSNVGFSEGVGVPRIWPALGLVSQPNEDEHGWSMQNHISRRDFFKIVTIALGSFIGAGIGLPVIGYLISPALRLQDVETWIPLGEVEKIPIGIPTFLSFTRKQVNGWENTVTSYGVFAVRKDADNIIVLSNICTHLGCHVTWHPDIHEYVSPCHNGHFDIKGKVTFGPPPRPLDEFKTKIEDGKLFILFPPYRRS